MNEIDHPNIVGWNASNLEMVMSSMYVNLIHMVTTSMWSISSMSFCSSMSISVIFSHCKFMNHVHFHPFWLNLSIHLIHLIDMVNCICMVNSIHVRILVHECSFINVVLSLCRKVSFTWPDFSTLLISSTCVDLILMDNFPYWGLFPSNCQLSSMQFESLIDSSICNISTWPNIIYMLNSVLCYSSVLEGTFGSNS